MTRMESIRQWLKRCGTLARAFIEGRITGRELPSEVLAEAALVLYPVLVALSPLAPGQRGQDQGDKYRALVVGRRPAAA